MAREARQADSAWLPAELLGTADDGVPDQPEAWHPAEEQAEESRLVGAEEPGLSVPEEAELSDEPEFKVLLPLVPADDPEPDVREEAEVSNEPRVAEELALAEERKAETPSEQLPEGAELPEQPAPAWAPTGPASPAPLPAGILDLNDATFDQLRRVGLSFHEAAGLIGRREQRGGFNSPDELDELAGAYGLRPEAIESLKQAASA